MILTFAARSTHALLELVTRFPHQHTRETSAPDAGSPGPIRGSRDASLEQQVNPHDMPGTKHGVRRGEGVPTRREIFPLP
jgi:hypothetical protein